MEIRSGTTMGLRAVEHALTQLWSQAASAELREEGHALIRARALTLIICSLAEGDTSGLASIVDEISDKHPCRAIVIVPAEGDAGPGLEASLAVYCRASVGSGAHVCGERITISVASDAVGELPSALRSVLLPDLPVFVWCRGPLPSYSKVLQSFLDFSDRIIVDSGDFPEPLALTEFVARGQIGPAFSDLAWTRLTSWRQLAAQFFDSPNFRPYLKSLNHAVIEYGAPGGRRHGIAPEALLLGGWLASRLNWRPRERSPLSSSTLELVQNDRTILLDFRSVSSQHDLVSLRLTAQGDPPALFSVARLKDPGCIETKAEVTGAPPITRIAHAKDESLVHLLSSELGIVGHDAVFEETLLAAETIASHVSRVSQT